MLKIFIQKKNEKEKHNGNAINRKIHKIYYLKNVWPENFPRLLYFLCFRAILLES